MSKIVISGKKTKGESFRLEVKKDIGELSLRREDLTFIDLSPLAECQQLKELNLSDNKLSGVDLSPLAKCSNLLRLSLSDNQITSLDLSPLARCLWFKRLSLVSNPLTSVNLAPLAGCSELQELFLDPSTKILWESASLHVHELPPGLKKYQMEIVQAQQQYSSAQWKKEKNISRLFQSGRGCINNKEFAKAEKLFLKILTLQPDHQGARKILEQLPLMKAGHLVEKAEHYLARKKLAEAQRYFAKALHIVPDYPGALKGQEKIRARKEQVEQLVAEGELLLEKGELDKAAACFTRALELNPRDREARGPYNRIKAATELLEEGAAELASNDLAAAQKHFTRALELVPNYPLALRGQEKLRERKKEARKIITEGKELLRKGKLEEALDCFILARLFDNREQEAHRLYQQVSNLVKAIQKLLTVLPEFPPGSQISLSTLAEHCQLSEKVTEEAITVLHKHHPEIGTYQSSPKVFVPKAEAETAIDDLLQSFEEAEEEKE